MLSEELMKDKHLDMSPDVLGGKGGEWKDDDGEGRETHTHIISVLHSCLDPVCEAILQKKTMWFPIFFKKNLSNMWEVKLCKNWDSLELFCFLVIAEHTFCDAFKTNSY